MPPAKHSQRRLEDSRLLVGQGSFVGDLKLPGASTAAFLRSPYAHARLVGIDARAARALAGVEAVLTAADLGPLNTPMPMMVPIPPPKHGVTQRPLAADVVRYQGESVAVVLAVDRYLAEDALGLIEVEYDPLSPVLDPERALAQDAPLLHPETESNLVGEGRLSIGDATRAFDQADLIVRTVLSMSRLAPQPLEARGLLASYDHSQNLLTLWSSTQIPHRSRDLLAQLLGRPEDSIRVVAPDVGGGFGSKLCLYPEELVCAYLALKTGNPVRWLEDRLEHTTASAHGRDQRHVIELALRTDGTVLAVRDRFVHDNGAYAPYGIRVPSVTIRSLVGPYRIPNIAAEFVSVFTNKAPVIPYRGAGQPEGNFALERALDLAAQRLGIEPGELRARNLIAAEALPYDTGVEQSGRNRMVYDSGDYFASLEDVSRRVDIPAFRAEQARARAHGHYFGLGIACYIESTGDGAYEGAVVRVDNLGYVSVTAGIASQGQGHATMLARLCAEVLEVPLERIRVRLGDTGLIPYGVGTWGSRGAVAAGNAVWEAASSVREKAVRMAAALLEVTPTDVCWEAGAAYLVGLPDRRLDLAELARASAPSRGALLLPEGPGLEGRAFFTPAGTTYANGVHAALVEVDVQQGTVKLRRYLVSHDCGRVIDQVGVDSQIVGAVAQGVGAALLEQLAYDEAGQVATASLMDYLLPTADDVPVVELRHRETPSPRNPLGFKGVGEGGLIPSASAIAGAVEDALAPFGVQLREIPITPDRLVHLLRRD